jgi:hypothetical protein
MIATTPTTILAYEPYALAVGASRVDVESRLKYVFEPA